MATEVRTTCCPLDCPDTCALEVTVADERIAHIRGAREHPITGGFICDKVAGFSRRVYHDERVLHPLRRTGPKGSGRYESISWEEAIAEIAARFREIAEKWGAEAILPYHYGGSNGFLSDGFLDDYFFARLGASRLARTLCAAPATEVATGMYGKMPGVAFEDFPRARCIVIWGGNPKASNIHLVPFLRRAKQNGAFLAVVDPRNNFSSGQMDLHLPVYPGADLPVALAMIRLWRERGRFDTTFLREHGSGVEKLLARAEEWPLERAAAAARVSTDDIRRLADVYADSAPAVIRVGWGLERNTNGGQAIAALLAMPALLGKFGVRGGGYTLSNSGGAKLDLRQIFGDVSWKARELNMTRLGVLLTDDAPSPPIRGLFVYNCNPAVTVPDQGRVLAGLSREDLFTVVHDQVMTDTAALADIVLPATTFLEHRDIRRGYGAYVMGGVRPVISARGEAKPNEEVFALLGRAMGWSDAPFQWDSETCARKIAAAVSMNGARPAPVLLEAGRAQEYGFSGAPPVQFGTVFPRTADGKIHFHPPCLGERPFEYREVRSEKYPLAMISPANNKMVSSTMGEYNYPELRVTLHPADAAARGIAEGDAVRVFNELGEVRCRARTSSRIREGVVSMPKGAWRRSSQNGLTATALCPATVDNVGGGACFNDARVEVAKA